MILTHGKKDGAGRHVPPPLLFLLGYVAGEGLEAIAPLPLTRVMPLPASWIGGLLLIALGVAVALCCFQLFLAAKTTVLPYRRAATLVTRGPYRLSRNPMYVSMALVYLGVACLRAVLWPVLLLPFPLAILNYRVIPYEESLLRATFGAAYEEYCKRVRRWL